MASTRQAPADASSDHSPVEIDTYSTTNATLRALYEERMQRSCNRRWNAPDDFDLGHDLPPLRLCSLPGRYLGAQVWLSGHLVARFIASRACRAFALEKGSSASGGVRCLELGAGLGVAGLAAAAAGVAREVVLTDKAEMVPLLRHNIDLNGLSAEGRCRAECLDWGCAPPLEWGPFDIVLAADVIYPMKDTTCLVALRDTIFEVCKPGSNVSLVLAYHERAREDKDFLEHEFLPHFDIVSVDEISGASVGDDKMQSTTTCKVYTCRRKASSQV
eukprot:TRINITY_DN33464_c0_g1_i1.p1 TRINITY_DN33464_c0_g1~~TRINITY_DN33464_c0_g1_i1.p1  ORF type:complete len:289 (-),score=38.44 TRINITY_DN33464_c0_g1_i1:316-1137(-)